MTAGTRPGGTEGRTLAATLALLLLYVLPPVLVAGPAAAAGASVRGLPASWPATLIGCLLRPGTGIRPWVWMGWGGPVRTMLFWVLLLLELAVLGLVGAGMRSVFRAGIRGAGDPARWASGLELIRAGLVVARARPRRLILGRPAGLLAPARFVATPPGVSVVVFGPTGSGKSAGICVPHILEWDGPVVAVSVKNDLVVQTAGRRQRIGRTDVFDPTAITGLGTCTWSPLAGCRSFDRAMRTGQWLVEPQGTNAPASGRDAEWAHWEDAAIRLVSTALYAGAHLAAPIGEVLSWLDDGSGTRLGRALAAAGREDARAGQWYRSVQERPDRERASCYSTSQKALRPYIERTVAASAEEPGFDVLRLLESENDTLYLVAPQAEQARLAGIFTGLVMSVLVQATELAQSRADGRLRRPLLLVLDECANTAPLRELPQYLSTARSMGITLVAIFQDLSQCESRYRDLAGSIVNNARAVLFLGGSKDRRTLELLRDLAGRRQQARYTTDAAGGWQRSTEREELLPLDAGRRLAPGRSVLLLDHRAPIAVRLRSCYRDHDLRRRRVRFLPRVTEIAPAPASTARTAPP